MHHDLSPIRWLILTEFGLVIYQLLHWCPRLSQGTVTVRFNNTKETAIIIARVDRFLALQRWLFTKHLFHQACWKGILAGIFFVDEIRTQIMLVLDSGLLKENYLLKSSKFCSVIENFRLLFIVEPACASLLRRLLQSISELSHRILDHALHIIYFGEHRLVSTFREVYLESGAISEKFVLVTLCFCSL